MPKLSAIFTLNIQPIFIFRCLNQNSVYITLVHLRTAVFYCEIKISPYLNFIILLNVIFYVADLSLMTRAVFTDLWPLPVGLHPVFLRESSDAAGELHHPSTQTDGEPAASAGKRGQDPVLHGPRHQLLPRGQRHRQDHQRRVRRHSLSGAAVWWGKRDSVVLFPLGRPAGWTSIWRVLQRFKRLWNISRTIIRTAQNSTQWYTWIDTNWESQRAVSLLNRYINSFVFGSSFQLQCSKSPTSVLVCRKHALRREKSCWRQSSATFWPATASPSLPSSSSTPSVWTRNWRCRRRWCWSTSLKPCSRTSSASLAGWWNMAATRVRPLPSWVPQRRKETF